MHKAIHARQRSLAASAKYWTLPRSGRSRIRRALNTLRPYQTDTALIRLGPDGDGGYLVPDCLDGIRAGFSPGVSETFGFDLELVRRGIPVHMADASVDRPADLPDGVTFDALFLGTETGGQWITLDDWVARYAPGDGDLLLQMDIEGAEYGVLDAASPETLRRFRIIVIELHGLHRFPRSSHFDIYERALQKLGTDFVTVHLHPNNVVQPVSVGPHAIPPVFEATLLRRDCIRTMTPNDHFPHPLDSANVKDAPDVSMGVFWDWD